MIPTVKDLEYFVRPFPDDRLTFDDMGTDLKATRCLAIDAMTGKVSETDGFSSIKHTEAIKNGLYIHVYMPCTDRIRPDVLHAMIRHAEEEY